MKTINAPLLKRRTVNLLYGFVRFVIIFGLAFIILRPIIYKTLFAFMAPSDLLDNSVNIIPKHWSLYYWREALDGLNLSVTLPNTIWLSLSIGLIQVAVCTLVGYGLGRFKFPGSRLAFAAVIVIMLVPIQTISSAQYLNFVYFNFFGLRLNLSDSFWPMYILALGGMGIKQGLYIYLFKEQFAALPDDLEQAAYIDGAGIFQTFLRVMLPNAGTTMVTVFLFTFCWQWTDTTYSNLYMTDLKVLANSISDVQIRIGLSWDETGTLIARNAASLIIMIPLLALFGLCQKFLVQSISRAGLSDG